METCKAAKDKQNHKEHVGESQSFYAERGLNSAPLLRLLVLLYFLLSQLAHTMPGSNWLGRQVSAEPAALKAWVLGVDGVFTQTLPCGCLEWHPCSLT